MLKKLFNKLLPKDTATPGVTEPVILRNTTECPKDEGFNYEATLPYGCSIIMVRKAMNDVVDVLESINITLSRKGFPKLERLLEEEFNLLLEHIIARSLVISNYSITLNKHSFRYPTIIPANKFPDDKCPASSKVTEGINICVQRNSSDPMEMDDVDLEFIYDSNTANHPAEFDRPFKFFKVITKSDWIYDITESE